MAEKKKEEKPLVDPFSLMKTEELLAEYEKHHANTPEAASKRASYDHEKEGYMNLFESVQTKYFISKRGESAKTAGAPKTSALSKKDMNVESSELINKMLLAMVEQDHTDDKGVVNKAVVDMYKSDPSRLVEYALGKGINYHELKQDIMNNYRNVKNSKKLEQFKHHAANKLVRDIEKINRITTEMYSNSAHHGKIKSTIKKAFEKTGYTLEDTVNVPEALQHYASHLLVGGKLSEDYLFTHEDSIKKYEKPAK